MGALSPIANLIGFSTASAPATSNANASAGGTSSTPPLNTFFGLDSNFLKTPAGGTALFNNLLYSTSSQQVPVNFLGMGYYNGVPPLFGGQGFTGLPSSFDMFGNTSGPTGLEAILNLGKQVQTKATTTTSKAATDKTDSKKTTVAKSTPDNGSISVETLKKMTLGDLLKLLSSK